MNLARALGEVLACLESASGPAIFNYDIVAQWDAGVLNVLTNCGLLEQANTAQSIECRGCEERCFSDVVVEPSKAGEVRAFVVCEVPEKQAQMGRVPIAPERLGQWQCSRMLLARFLLGKLGIFGELEAGRDSQRIRLCMMKAANRRRWISLVLAPLALEVNGQLAPILELLFVEDGAVVLDMPRIQHLLCSEVGAAGKGYVPNTDRREVQKMNTQAMYQEWQDAYVSQLQDHPDKGKKWHSQMIARMPVARGRDSETIRKHLN